jgi:hypothetical protein
MPNRPVARYLFQRKRPSMASQSIQRRSQGCGHEASYQKEERREREHRAVTECTRLRALKRKDEDYIDIL